MLDRQTPDHSLCHFDVHPNNVLMGPTQPIIIDWFDAAAGNPAADIVRSSLLMWSDAAAGHMPCVDPSLIDVVHHHYIASVARIRDVDSGDLLEWEVAVMASRLAEPLPDSMRQATHEALRALSSSRQTRLDLSLRQVTS